MMTTKVSWIHVDKQLLLTTQEAVRTSSHRIRVRRENNTFTLIIENVGLDDVGYYACRVRKSRRESLFQLISCVLFYSFFFYRSIPVPRNLKLGSWMWWVMFPVFLHHQLLTSYWDHDERDMHNNASHVTNCLMLVVDVVFSLPHFSLVISMNI